MRLIFQESAIGYLFHSFSLRFLGIRNQHLTMQNQPKPTRQKRNPPQHIAKPSSPPMLCFEPAVSYQPPAISRWPWVHRRGRHGQCQVISWGERSGPFDDGFCRYNSSANLCFLQNFLSSFNFFVDPWFLQPGVFNVLPIGNPDLAGWHVCAQGSEICAP